MDKRAKRILISHFWTSSGWVPENQRKIDVDDLEYAKQKGLMFDPISVSHDALLADIKALVSTIQLSEVATAFLFSLSTRELNLRSCLGSYVYALHIPDHSHTESDRCPVCGYFGGNKTTGLNVLSFERVQWGGVRHEELEYVWFDLSRFKAESQSHPPLDDRILLNLIDALSSCPKGLAASKIESQIQTVFKSNKAEREIALGILGICNVLNHPDYPGFLYKFTHAKNRVLPNQRYVDLLYPFCWYNSDFGVNNKAIQRLFNTGGT